MIRAALFALAVILGPIASAHDLDLTLIRVERGHGGTEVIVTTPLSRLVKTANLGPEPTGPDLDIAVRERLGINQGIPSAINVDTQSDMVAWTATLDGESGFKPARFDDSTPAAETIVATYEEGQLVSESVLRAGISQPSALAMAGTGICHILSGWDHILFVAGLAMLGVGWKSLAKLLTAFTVAHSLTLFAASTGLLHGNPQVVEPLIAVSIVALALEGLRHVKNPESGNSKTRLLITFAFGLVHGLGFAGGLADLGLSGKGLISSVLMFSIGIEAGQVLILVPSVLLIALVAKLSQERAVQLTAAATVCLGMTGCFWFMERIF